MAKYKCDPNYEVIRPKVYVQFSPYGDYETTDKRVIAVLDDCGPFVKRVNTEPEPEDRAEAPKADAKPTPVKPQGKAQSSAKK
jgi:hypothetical protein